MTHREALALMCKIAAEDQATKDEASKERAAELAVGLGGGLVAAHAIPSWIYSAPHSVRSTISGGLTGVLSALM